MGTKSHNDIKLLTRSKKTIEAEEIKPEPKPKIKGSESWKEFLESEVEWGFAKYIEGMYKAGKININKKVPLKGNNMGETKELPDTDIPTLVDGINALQHIKGVKYSRDTHNSNFKKAIFDFKNGIHGEVFYTEISRNYPGTIEIKVFDQNKHNSIKMKLDYQLLTKQNIYTNPVKQAITRERVLYKTKRKPGEYIITSFEIKTPETNNPNNQKTMERTLIKMVELIGDCALTAGGENTMDIFEANLVI